MSLLRVVLVVPIVYCLVLNTPTYTRIAFLLLFVAAATDFFDGFLARRLNQQTALGLILDPVADKLLAIALLIGLIFTREFPLWAAALIIGRDLVIMLAALIVSRYTPKIPRSDAIGKYYFGIMAALLMSYMIRFSFGQTIFMIATMALLVASSLHYFYNFLKLMQTGEFSELGNHPVVLWVLRIGFWVLVLWGLWRLFM